MATKFTSQISKMGDNRMSRVPDAIRAATKEQEGKRIVVTMEEEDCSFSTPYFLGFTYTAI